MTDDQLLDIAETLLYSVKELKDSPINVKQLNALNSIAASLLMIARHSVKPEQHA